MPAFNVVALGARDYYQVAIALHQRGLLGRLITDFYGGRFFKRFTASRSSPDLPDSKVLSSWPHAVGLYLLRGTRFNTPRRHLVDFSFGFLAALVTFLGPNRAIVYSYYLEGFCAFYRLIRSRPKCLLCFQVHPTPWMINSIIAEDTRRFADYAEVRFRSDIEATFDERDYHRYRRATAMCHGLIAASQITIRSVFESQAPSVPVCVAPYGSKLSVPSSVPTPPDSASDRIRILSVCQLTQRKGLHWAFEAMKRLSPQEQARYSWTVVANYVDPNVAALIPGNVTLLRSLSNQELSQHFRRSDVFLLPSLIEGFGLVYVESLSQGTPIVYTPNTGAYDLCTPGVHGFCVPISDLESLVALLRQQLCNRPLLSSLRHHCVELAAQVTWAHFRELVADFAANAAALELASQTTPR
jgi:glycosyltransferase involved in cell wall biosynthesis